MNTRIAERKAATTGLAPLRHFIRAFAALLDERLDDQATVTRGAPLLAALLAAPDWLPDAYARTDPDRYQHYLLHCDSGERFSIVSFVWGPGQSTPIHDHRLWGLVGVLRGAEQVEHFRRGTDGRLHPTSLQRLEAGRVDSFVPGDAGELHRVANASADTPAISIHVYGGNIGRVERATYQPDGTPKPFVSGYSNDRLPNLWAPSA
ncbi:cysteine dioxygenase [Sphingobium sufflavum]|uniref:cysteine dioxygenase family protein n=1 Tax=Sphingobium sufflavum TaxID=1129547 RepID=UPI001F1A90E9|nr:cysteine dioxygenase [Sphingobium sufflavum]MCE7796697.1 cysteine dioxygenase [Sphingobium sufflavum]